MSDYPHRIFLTFPNNARPYQIPVPPENIAGGKGSIIQTYELITFGEVMTLGGVQLERFRWESFFPGRYDPSVSVIREVDHQPPVFWQARLDAAMESQAPCRITIQNTPIDFSAAVASFKWSYVPGEFGDLWYQIEMVQYRQGFIREYDGINLPLLVPREEPTPPSKKPLSRWYMTKKDDTFEKISILYFGTDRYARRIYEFNRKALDAALSLAGSAFRTIDAIQASRWTFGDKLPAGIAMYIPEIGPGGGGEGDFIPPTTG